MMDHSRKHNGIGDDLDLSSDERRVRALESHLVFFIVLLFGALVGLYATLSFVLGDLLPATVFACTGLLIAAGLVIHFFAGLRLWLRLYYCLWGAVVYFFVLLAAEPDPLALFAAVGLVPGFVAVLGWRLGALWVPAIIVATVVAFWFDLYFRTDSLLPAVVEIKFIIAAVGLGALAVGYAFAAQTSVDILWRASIRARENAYYDELTRLASRKAMAALLQVRLEECRRRGSDVSVIMLRIDNLAALGNTFGVDFADGVLVRFANVLARGLRGQDVAARWARDCFMVLLPGEGRTSASGVAQRLCRQTGEIELVMAGQRVEVEVSSALASTEDAVTLDDLIARVEGGLTSVRPRGDVTPAGGA